MKKYSWIAIAVAAAAFLLDLGTKQLALTYLDPVKPVKLCFGLVTLQLTHNPGAAFSLGENFTIVFTLLSVLATLIILFWAIPRVNNLLWSIALGLMLGGVMGNGLDRLLRPPALFKGHVVDFIQLPYFAIFNVADICITVTAVFLCYLLLLKQVNLTGSVKP